MKKTIFVYSLIVIGLFLTACNVLPPSSSISEDSEILKPNDTSITQSAPPSSETASSSSPVISKFNDEKAVEYALTVAKYFREPITSTADLKNNPHLYEFLVNTTFQLCEDQKIFIENISENDWYQEYLIPNEYLEKTASLLLNTDLPEIFYTNDDFQYIPEENAFRYSPFSPPMFETSSNGMMQNEDGTVSIIIAISKIEQAGTIENVYTFQAENDSQWGEIYQLLSVKEY